MKKRIPKSDVEFAAFVADFRRACRAVGAKVHVITAEERGPVDIAGLPESKLALNAHDMVHSGKLRAKQVRVVPKHNLYKKGK